MSTRKSRRTASDVKFCDGDSTISTAISRAERRLDRVRVEAMPYTHVVR